ncbi:MAG: chemotaxis protein CheB [Nitrospira sp.]|nr:chemotaxis protein CheB [Nitrospira sp.]
MRYPNGAQNQTSRHFSARPSPAPSLINEQRIIRDVIVLGASAGGIEVLRRVLCELPTDLPAIIGIVLHRPPNPSRLVQVLGMRAGMEVVEGCDHARLNRGCIVVAPPDHHLEFGSRRMVVRRGPKEHSARPAIDPLFRSASHAFGRRVVGMLLSGGGDDGVSGLILIKRNGGISLAQDPTDADMPFLPMNAVRYDHPDGVLPTRIIASTLIALVDGQTIEC